MFAGWIATMLIVFFVILRGKSGVGGGNELLFGFPYFVTVLVDMAVRFCTLLAGMLPAFFVIKYVIEGISYAEEKFETDYNFREFLMLSLQGALLTAVTFGIYAPWFITKVIKYFAGKTYFRYNAFTFNGKPFMLFSLMIVLSIVPSMLLSTLGGIASASLMTTGALTLAKWIPLLAIIVLFLSCIFSGFAGRWFIDFSYGPKIITSTVNGWHAGFFMFGQMLLSIVTIGFYVPMYMLRSYRYFMKRTVLGDEIVEDQFGFTLNAWRDYGCVLGHSLLTIITLGIYLPWWYAKVAKRMFTQTYIELVEEQKISMPERR